MNIPTITFEQLEIMRDHQTLANTRAIELLLIEAALWGEADLSEIDDEYISQGARIAVIDLYNDLFPAS
jgi:hypothetical protein